VVGNRAGADFSFAKVEAPVEVKCVSRALRGRAESGEQKATTSLILERLSNYKD
jgi:hypothetical protein